MNGPLLLPLTAGIPLIVVYAVLTFSMIAVWIWRLRNGTWSRVLYLPGAWYIAQRSAVLHATCCLAAIVCLAVRAYGPDFMMSIKITLELVVLVAGFLTFATIFFLLLAMQDDRYPYPSESRFPRVVAQVATFLLSVTGIPMLLGAMEDPNVVVLWALRAGTYSAFICLLTMYGCVLYLSLKEGFQTS